ncbi:MAG: type I-F CRISPR-associated protein Csy2, partial [Gammaproteobacteria bacterium]|nr:type I-F CRISPR-associated protein Csy2 [Gammaproteobacteria bacterium]
LDKNGKRPSFVEEARCHLDVSLLIEYDDPDGDIDDDVFLEHVNQLVRGKMRFSGGVVLESSDSMLYEIHNEASLKPLLGKLMPGHCLIERRDLMQSAMQEGQDALDALLDSLKVTHRSEQDEKGKISWSSGRKETGWIVPIATGFHGITELGEAQNQRDATTPHRFAESVVTLGEFVMPYRIADLDQMLWHYQIDLENNLYLCQQNRPKSGI